MRMTDLLCGCSSVNTTKLVSAIKHPSFNSIKLPERFTWHAPYMQISSNGRALWDTIHSVTYMPLHHECKIARIYAQCLCIHTQQASPWKYRAVEFSDFFRRK